MRFDIPGASLKPGAEEKRLDGFDVVVNDYAGHPFQIDLSNELQSLGHSVTHLYCNTNVTPRGALQQRPKGPSIRGISTGDRFDKYDVKKRLLAELRYGFGSVKALLRNRPDVAVSSNVPLVALALITVACRLLRIRHVLWLQDFQAGLVSMKLGEDHLVSRGAEAAERWCVRNAAHVVAISAGFERAVIEMGVPSSLVTTIPNWAPIADMPTVDRCNDWSAEHDLDGRRVFLYSGTLGIKHRPEALVALAEHLRLVDPDALVVVVSESIGVEWIDEQRTSKNPLENLIVLPFQPFDRLPEVLGSADVLVVLLEEDAGEFSVPSKVLSYLCAGRPVLGLMPGVNAAADLISNEAAAGLVAEDIESFLNDGEVLAKDGELRLAMGKRGRTYAEDTFEVAQIAMRFLEIFDERKMTE